MGLCHGPLFDSGGVCSMGHFCLWYVIGMSRGPDC